MAYVRHLSNQATVFVKMCSNGAPVFKLGDFGFGAVMSAKEDHHTFLGTLGFIAPVSMCDLQILEVWTNTCSGNPKRVRSMV
jgi:hypothetical protein